MFLSKIFGGFSNSTKKYQPLIDQINALEATYEKLSDEELKQKSSGLQGDIKSQLKTSDEILPDAFALVREAAKRNLKQRHFDVQLIGGTVLNQGKITEMSTGEGKTLTATLAIYLNALSGNGAHVMTVNDYLAKRDAVWMGQIYYALGLSVGCLAHESSYVYDPHYKIPEKVELFVDQARDATGNFLVQMDYLRPVSRKEAYLTDITYGTNHEFGFDYLRDNLAYAPENQVQRGHSFVIVDEVDSILIDEARTPLIISAPDVESSQYYKTFAKIVRTLEKDADYTIEEKYRSVDLTQDGITKVEKAVGVKNIYDPEHLRLLHYLRESLKAYAVFKLDKDYVVKNGEIIIVDEFTGRMMHGRRYSGGLHQAIEAKEGVFVQNESRTYAQISIQNYVRLYKKISGMTGTAQTSAEEFDTVYGLDVVTIPTNRINIRKDVTDKIYKNRQAKLSAVVADIKERHQKGQPVLVGTTSIQKNEELAAALARAGVPHQLLNAKNHEKEGAVIAQAGKLKGVTVATNMAGRGVDIILGGNPTDSVEALKVRELGGLHVIGTDRHESRRIDNQLRGRAGRQGDPGSSQFFLSPDDDLLRIFGGEKLQGMMNTLNVPEDMPIESRLITRIISDAQAKVEGLNFDARKNLLEYDDVLNTQRKTIYNLRQELLEKKGHPMLLGSLDQFWMNHLENMESLAESVRLRAYGQHDPLVEYKREGRILYQQLLADYENWKKENEERITMTNDKLQMTNQNQISNSKNMSLPQDNPYKGQNIGRNDPCPCGSGKKYKKCHGV